MARSMAMMRSLLLAASQNSWLRTHAPRYRFVRRTVARFMPGEQIDDALAAAGRLQSSKLKTIFTHLGENITSALEAEQVRDHYLGVLDRIGAASLPAEVSVKLTHLGLDLGDELCCQNVAPLLEHPAAAQRVIWVDMEGSAYTERTLAVFHRLRAARSNVGVCVQAYLHRTKDDLEKLIAAGAAVRLVKGAYREPPSVAIARKKDVDENYFWLAQRLLSAEARQHGVRAAIATHDRDLIARIIAWAENNDARSVLEFQMLYGIQSAEQLRLAAEGYDSRVLIAYGAHWYAWFMRRLAERPANVWFVAKNLF
jgi:proline dehydrogenase